MYYKTQSRKKLLAKIIIIYRIALYRQLTADIKIRNYKFNQFKLVLSVSIYCHGPFKKDEKIVKYYTVNILKSSVSDPKKSCMEDINILWYTQKDRQTYCYFHKMM